MYNTITLLYTGRQHNIVINNSSVKNKNLKKDLSRCHRMHLVSRSLGNVAQSHEGKQLLSSLCLCSLQSVASWLYDSSAAAFLSTAKF